MNVRCLWWKRVWNVFDGDFIVVLVQKQRTATSAEKENIHKIRAAQDVTLRLHTLFHCYYYYLANISINVFYFNVSFHLKSQKLNRTDCLHSVFRFSCGFYFDLLVWIRSITILNGTLKFNQTAHNFFLIQYVRAFQSIARQRRLFAWKRE